jgi:hypothetical protein
MSENTAEDAAESASGESSTDPQDAAVTADDGGTSLPADEKMRRYLWWGAFLGLGLFAGLAALNFYWSATETIGVWVSSRYESLFRAAFNLAVLLAAGAGLAVLARRRA